MTELSTSDRLLIMDGLTYEVITGTDSFISGYGGGWHGNTTSLMRVNCRLEPIWSRSYFSEDSDLLDLGTRVEGREIALTKDGAFLYAVGQGDTVGALSVPMFLKIDAVTGDIEWEREATGLLAFRYLALDKDENIIIFGVDNVNFETGILKKYSPDGNPIWSIAIGGVTGIACDSEDHIYCTVTNEDTRIPNTPQGLYKLDKENGDVLWFAAANSNFRDIAINKNDEIFVIGGEEDFESVPCQLFKYASDSNERLAAVPVGNVGFAIRHGQRVVCDSLGNVIAINWTDTGIPPDLFEYMLTKFTSDLAIVWEYEYEPRFNGPRVLAVDVQNRIHTWGASTVGGAYRVHASSDGMLEVENDRLRGNFAEYGLVCSRIVYEGLYTDQISNLARPDMCCFQDATMAKMHPDEDIAEDEEVWLLHNGTIGNFYWLFLSPADNWTGVFKSKRLHSAPQGDFLIGNSEQLELLSRTPPCLNDNWELYDGFGGVGVGPQLYTVTFINMLNVSDGQPSEYNGEYLMIIGPGLMGFFFRHENGADLLKINFTVEDSYLDLDGYINEESGKFVSGDGLEKLSFTVGDDEGNVFTYVRIIQDYSWQVVYDEGDLVLSEGIVYKSQQNFNEDNMWRYDPAWWIAGKYHDERLTAVDNDNGIGTENAITYGGTASIHPGRIAQWDPDTIWATDEIVAWEGRFHQANNQNQDSEPPSGDWTTI